MKKSKLRKIAILTCRLEKGFGVDIVVNAQANELARRGYTVTVYTLAYDASFFERPRYQVRVLSGSSEEWVQLLQTAGHDVIVAHTSPFFEILPRLRESAMVIAWEHGDPTPELFPAEETAVRRQIKLNKEKNVYHACHGVVAISHFIARDIGWPAAFVNYNGTDHLANRPLPRTVESILTAKQELGLPLKKTVLSVCRLGKGESFYKGVDLLVELRKYLPEDEWQVLVVGRGTEDDKRLWESQGLLVLTNVDNDRLRTAFESCDVFVSMSKWEGFNLPLVEAQRLRCPALALDATCHREVCRHVFGSAAELAEFLKSHDSVALGEIAEQGFRHVAEWTWKANVDRLEGYLGACWKEYTPPSRRVCRQFLKRVLVSIKLIGKRSALQLERENPKLGTFLRRIQHARRAFFSYVPPVVASVEPSQGSSAVAACARFEPNFQIEKGLISVCILTKNRLDLIKPCLESLLNNCGDVRLEILVGDTGSNEPEVLEFYRSLPSHVRVEMLGFYNFSASNNVIAQKARGEFLLFLNNDTLVLPGALSALQAAFVYPRVGIAGPKMLFRDGTIQHAGCEIFTREPYRFVGWHPYSKFPADCSEANLAKEMPGVTGACLMIRNELFRSVGGFDEVYLEECQDIDLCLKVRRSGSAVIYLPQACIYHFENGTRTLRESGQDRGVFRERWGAYISESIFSAREQSEVWHPQICITSYGGERVGWASFIKPGVLPLPAITFKGIEPYELPENVRMRRVIPADYEDPVKYDFVTSVSKSSSRS